MTERKVVRPEVPAKMPSRNLAFDSSSPFQLDYWKERVELVAFIVWLVLALGFFIFIALRR